MQSFHGFLSCVLIAHIHMIQSISLVNSNSVCPMLFIFCNRVWLRCAKCEQNYKPWNDCTDNGKWRLVQNVSPQLKCKKIQIHKSTIYQIPVTMLRHNSIHDAMLTPWVPPSPLGTSWCSSWWCDSDTLRRDPWVSADAPWWTGPVQGERQL